MFFGSARVFFGAIVKRPGPKKRPSPLGASFVPCGGRSSCCAPFAKQKHLAVGQKYQVPKNLINKRKIDQNLWPRGFLFDP